MLRLHELFLTSVGLSASYTFDLAASLLKNGIWSCAKHWIEENWQHIIQYSQAISLSIYNYFKMVTYAKKIIQWCQGMWNVAFITNGWDNTNTGQILGFCPVNEIRRYPVTMSAIGWVQA